MYLVTHTVGDPVHWSGGFVQTSTHEGERQFWLWVSGVWVQMAAEQFAEWSHDDERVIVPIDEIAAIELRE